jgi:uncharacterized protein YfiM (DUF2279 family)
MRHTLFVMRYNLVLFVAALLVACAQMGVPTPDTFNAKLAVGIGTVTELRQAATTLVLAHKISPDDADNVLKQTDNAAAGLTIARAMSTTDQTAANAKLAASVAVLTAIKAYLASQGSKP